MARQFHLHLVSDATGETVSAVARACIVQFKDVEPISHLWWLVRSPRQVERVVAGVKANPGLVLATVGPGQRSIDNAAGLTGLWGWTGLLIAAAAGGGGCALLLLTFWRPEVTASD